MPTVSSRDAGLWVCGWGKVFSTADFLTLQGKKKVKKRNMLFSSDKHQHHYFTLLVSLLSIVLSGAFPDAW